MKIIALLAVAAMLLMFGSKSSVGGSITDMLVSFAVTLAVGIYKA